MKKQIIIGSLLIFLVSILTLSGQSQQQRKDLFPNVNTGQKNSVQLDRFSVQISVLGNIAITTYDMTFKNSENRVLEGQMEFPLQESEQVIGYQLEVNGKMRKGVVVEKAEARQVYEQVVNRRVDPGIVEKTQGNNYRTRLYPIPSKGTKRVIITTQQSLYKENGSYIYIFPFYSKTILSEFLLDIIVYNQNNEPYFNKNGLFNSIFDRFNKNFQTKIKLSNKALNEPFKLFIPFDLNQKDILFENNFDDHFFYTQLHFDSTLLKTMNQFDPDSIFVLWDNSLSGLSRDLEHEKIFLMQLLKKYSNKVVTIIPFHNTCETPLSCLSNDTIKIKMVLENMVYDGATNMNSLSNLHISESNLTLLFSDGINSLGQELEHQFNLGVLFSIISGSSNNYSLLDFLSNKNVLLIEKMSFEKCFEMIRNIPLKLISIETSKEVSDLTFKVGDYLYEQMTICGKLNTNSGSIILGIGYQNDPISIQKIELDYNKSYNISDEKTEISKVISRFWAQNKINNLIHYLPQSKSEIINLSKKHEIITDFTSLIVLETAADYYRYKIDPPEELRDQYDEYIKYYGTNKWNDSRDNNLQDMIYNNFYSYYLPLLNWYKHPIPILKSSSTRYLGKDTIFYVNKNIMSDYYQIRTTQNNSSILGIVRDFSNHRPLRNIIVTLSNSESAMQITMTDEYGFYSFKNVTPGEYKIDISSLACTSKQRFKNVLIDSNICTQFDMQYDCIEPIYNNYYDFSFGNYAAGNTVVRGNRGDGQQTIIDGVRVRGSGSVSTNVYSVDLNRTPGRSISSAISTSEGVHSDNIGFSQNGNSQIIQQNEIQNTRNKSQITLKTYNSEEKYLNSFRYMDESLFYSNYLTIRNDYLYTPSFYVNIADLFFQNGMKDTAKLILSNIIEMSNENFQLVQEYGNKLIEYGFYDEAVPVFKYNITLREEFPQSYRDYALACQWAGKYQEALDTMNVILTKKWNKFDEIKMVVFNELNALITSKGDSLNIANINPDFICKIPVQLRIVLSWNTDNCDIDLHVIEPNGIDCYYGYRNTQLGGRLAYDVRNGFGPEEYLMKDNVPGNYKIKTHYYATLSQSQLMPVTVYADIFTDYGTIYQKHKRISLKLINKNDSFVIGEVKIEPEKQ